MDEKPKSIWRKSWRGLGAIYILSLLVAMVVFLAAFIYALANWEKPVAETFTTAALAGVIFVVCCLSIIYFILPLSRWLFWKHWRRTLFSLACFATLIALFYAEENWRGRHDWEKFKREWEAKGEHFDYASIIPPPVPDDQNFALTPIMASSYEHVLDKNGKRVSPPNTNVVNRLQMDITHSNDNWPTNSMGNWQKASVSKLKPWQNYYHALATTTNQFPTTPQPQTPAQDVLLALSRYDSVIEELRTASQLPYSRFPLNYDVENPFATLLPHITAMKYASQVLQLRAIAELQAGEADKALADIKLSLRLIESIRTEPFLISQLVRIAMTEIALQPIYEGLAEHRWSDVQLVALDAELANLDFLADYQSAMRGERAMTCATIDFFNKKRGSERYQAFRDAFSMRAGDDDSVTLSGQLKNHAKVMGAYLMPSGWFTQNKFFISKGEQGWITGVISPEKHLASPQKYREVQQAENLSINTILAKPWDFLVKEFYPQLGASGRKSAREQISVDLARTAIALERYRLAHGEFPESLDALVPQFSAQLPHDVIGGQPLKYRREASGQFILYSVGWNETDDGGVTGYRKGGTAPDFESGDWVWRYPAK